jgi:hypothetical protein
MQLVKFLRGALVVLALTVGAIQCAHAAPPKTYDGAAPTLANTAGVVVLLANNDVAGFVFISKTGDVSPIGYSKCAASETCKALVNKLTDANAFTVLKVPGSSCEPSDTKPTKF